MTELPPGVDLDKITRGTDALRRMRAVVLAALGLYDMLDTVEIATSPPGEHVTQENAEATFRDEFIKTLQVWKAAWEGFPGRIHGALQVLGEHGWYLDPAGMGWPDLHDFAEGFTRGDADDTHEKLCQHFDGRMDEILEDVVVHFPNRAKIIRSAFIAHREGKYELSVPVLLAQTDGICRELVGVQLCGRRKKDGRLRTASVIESWKKDNLSRAMLHQLSVLLPIAFNEDERDGRPGILNRHAVLHGEDVTYDQRRQGCRAISLLGYVASVLRDREPDENAA